MTLGGFLKSFFNGKIPTLGSYSDIYNLAFEYVANNRNKRHLIKILEQSLTLNVSIKKKIFFTYISSHLSL